MGEYIVKTFDDRTEWYQNGQLHREAGPAIEFANGDKFWYKNGQLHREDDPAIEYVNGDKEWYLNDVELPESEFLERTMDQLAERFNIHVESLNSNN